MNLSNLQKITTRSKKRLGQGHGSGRVKTSGRGTKGQKARRSIPLDFEGGALPLIKRMPLLRGKGKNYSLKSKPEIIKLKQLGTLTKDTTVDVKTLVTHGLVTKKDAEKYGVKILGDGNISVALVVKVPVSQSAKIKIEKAGGSVEIGLNE